MNSSFAADLLARAREEFQKLEAQAKDSTKRKELAQDLSRQAKQKYKQAKKWARQTKKLLKKAKSDATEKLQVLERAFERLKEVEKKAVKEWNKTGAKPEVKQAVATLAKAKVQVKAKVVKRVVAVKKKVVKKVKAAVQPKPVVEVKAETGTVQAADSGAGPAVG